MAEQVELCPQCKGDVTGILSPFCSNCGARLNTDAGRHSLKNLLPLCRAIVALTTAISLIICATMIVGTDSSVNPPGFVGPNFACPAYISVLGFYFVQIPATFVGFVAAMGGLSIKSRDWFCIVGLAGQVLAMIGSGYVYASLR